MRRSLAVGIAAGAMFAAVLGMGGCANQDAVNAYVDAMMLDEMNNDQEAITKLEKAVAANPKFALAWSLMGEIHQKNNELEKSANAYEKATELNRWSYKDFFNLGEVYEAMNKYAPSVRAYVRATEISPNSGEAYLGAAKSYYQLKDYKNAMKYGRKAGALDPNTAAVQAILGDVYGATKEYEPAIAAYKRALEIDANNPEVNSALALMYLRTNKVEAAHELLTSVVANKPTSAVYQQLGYANLKLKRIDDAIAAYRKAVELDENDWSAHKGLGVALMLASSEKKDDALKNEAITEWQKSLKLQPEQPKLMELLEKYQ